MWKRTILGLAAVSTCILGGAGNAAPATVDAVSAPSLVVTITNVTQTQVTVNYTFDERAGTRNFCYAVSPATPSTVCVSNTPNSLTGTLVARNLLAGTTYNYALSAVDPTGRHRTSTTRGTFTTLKATVSVSGSTGAPKAPRVRPGSLHRGRDVMGRARGQSPMRPAR